MAANLMNPTYWVDIARISCVCPREVHCGEAYRLVGVPQGVHLLPATFIWIFCFPRRCVLKVADVFKGSRNACPNCADLNEYSRCLEPNLVLRERFPSCSSVA